LQGYRSNSAPFSKQAQEDVRVPALLATQSNSLLACNRQCRSRAGRAFVNSQIVPIQKRMPTLAERYVCHIPQAPECDCRSLEPATFLGFLQEISKDQEDLLAIIATK
jgi:hypothetical protein